MSLRGQAVSGVKWLGSSTGITAVLAMGQMVVMSHLLEPRDLGLLAMVWAVLGFAQALADMGLGNAIVQRRDLPVEVMSTIYWTTLGVGVALALLSFGAAPWIAGYYREPEMTPMVRWAGVSFVVVALGQPYRFLAQRELRFPLMAKADAGAAVVQFALATALAVAGAGPYSLLFGGMAGHLWRLLLLGGGQWRHWLPGLRWQAADLRDIWSFGALQMADRITNYFWSNIDYVLIGRYYGAGPLGLYRQAYETVVRPLETVNPVVNAVAFPLYARKQDDDAALRRGFLEVLDLLATLVFPLLAGLAAVAPEAIRTLYGEKWAGAVPLLYILAPLGILRSLLNPVVAVLLAKGMAGRVLLLNLSLAVVTPAAIWAALPLGLERVAVAETLSLAAVIVVSWPWLYARTFGLRAGEYLRTLARPALLSAVMAAVVWLTARGMEGWGLATGARLGILVVLGAGIYGGAHMLFFRAYVRRLRDTVLRRG